MFWQIVSFTFPDDREADRRNFEDDLRRLPSRIPELAAVRVARASDRVAVTGYVCAFSDEAAYRAYVEHPAHVPIGVTADALCIEVHRLLMSTPDDVTIIAASNPE
jgi:hypothetical protein